jgi:hypothetical protein
MSIGSYAMSELQSKQRIYEIFHRIGFSYSDRVFDEIFAVASHGSKNSCSINDFRKCLNDYLIRNNLV